MGSYGITNNSGGTYQQLKAQSRDFKDFESYDEAVDWFSNSRNSNQNVWINDENNSGLSSDELYAVERYTGSLYRELNKMMFNTPLENLSESNQYRQIVENLHDAINKFELKQGINVTRETDFRPFGKRKGVKMTVDEVKDFLNASGGVLQNDGALSFCAGDRGMGVSSSGLIIHLAIPKSKGYCAYVDPISSNNGENEVLVNNNSVFRYDPNSVRQDSGGRIHVNAYMLGVAKNQAISKDNKSTISKEKISKKVNAKK